MLERSRQLHEDVEQMERVAARMLQESKQRRRKHPRVTPLFDHAVADVLASLQRSSRQLLDIYADKDRLRIEELDFLVGRTKDKESDDDQAQLWLHFYDELRILRESSKQAAAAPGANKAAVSQTLLRDIVVQAQTRVIRSPALQVFLPSEALGLRIDMQQCYRAFLNLKKVREWQTQRGRQAEVTSLTRKLRDKKVPPEEICAKVEALEKSFEAHPPDYVVYLRTFATELREIPRHCKYNGNEYIEYLDYVFDHLRGYLVKVNPLADHDKIDFHISEEFDHAWDKRSAMLPSWEPLTNKLPLYCVPTDWLFASLGTLNAHREKSGKYAKALAALQLLSVTEQAAKLATSEARDREIARIEFCILRLSEILTTVIERTIDYLHDRQSRTWREIAAEDEGDAEITRTIQLAAEEAPLNKAQDEDESDDEIETDAGNGELYNPRNLPLGWDGKPIPFWLYQLHGLNVEYKCEICGNFSYWGRRAFERHFHEWRHSFGMKCLGIPNTAHFKEIVKIEDALVLWEKLRRDAQENAFDAANSLVEFEDPQGNLYTAPAAEVTKPPHVSQ